MPTFSIQTLGCKVNQYESEQIASLLRSRGLTPADSGDCDLKIINTCSVTVQAASKSRQSVRRATRLPVLQAATSDPESIFEHSSSDRCRVIVTGCWATSDPANAKALPGVDAVLGHYDDVASGLDRLLFNWGLVSLEPDAPSNDTQITTSTPPESLWNDGWMKTGELPVAADAEINKSISSEGVKEKISGIFAEKSRIGTNSLPLLDSRQAGHQRAVLKLQDGCDAHCTYCIIPQLRPRLWSKPVPDVIEEARRLVGAGHKELILTGIFLSAYGQKTALRRRQPDGSQPIAELLKAIARAIPDLPRLRLSSLEPGDLSHELISVMRDLTMIVPHFHLPLQSGSDLLLHRMNRQYSRDDFLRMVDRLQEAFDRPAITTDIIVGFPGETEEEFKQTLDIVNRVKFIHTHAFSYSPRPGTAAARWSDKMIHGPVVNERIEILNDRARAHSFEFRSQFVNELVELLVEIPTDESAIQHGRCERYFSVYFEHDKALTGKSVKVRIDRVTSQRTRGTLIEVGD